MSNGNLNFHGVGPEISPGIYYGGQEATEASEVHNGMKRPKETSGNRKIEAYGSLIAFAVLALFLTLILT